MTMTTRVAPICVGGNGGVGCTHLMRDANSRPNLPYRCEAFPEGVPISILYSEVDHRTPYKDDTGVTFAPADAASAQYASDLFSGVQAVGMVADIPILNLDADDQNANWLRILAAKRHADAAKGDDVGGQADDAARTANQSASPDGKPDADAAKTREPASISVRVGRVDVIYGTVSVDANGVITYQASNRDVEQILRNIVGNMAGPGWDDEMTVRSLPRRLSNYLWAMEVTADGEPIAGGTETRGFCDLP